MGSLKNIAFVVNGNFNVGMGHIYRSMTLASKLPAHKIHFYSHKNSTLGIKKLEASNCKVNIFAHLNGLPRHFKKKGVDIVINDILDTDFDYVKALKDKGLFVVNFEDTGEGAIICDLLINALYEYSGNSENAYYGYRYECLRDDIYLYPVKTKVSKEVRNILVGFGGVDINNATLKVLKMLDKLVTDTKTINVLLGIGYKYEKELYKFVKNIKWSKRLNIYKDVPAVSKYIYEADLVISGNGRMVYEVVALATPLLVCSQNERELSHIFPRICPGIRYAGDITNGSHRNLIKHLQIINSSYHYRRGMNEQLKQFAVEIRSGAKRIVELLWKTYYGKMYP